MIEPVVRPVVGAVIGLVVGPVIGPVVGPGTRRVVGPVGQRIGESKNQRDRLSDCWVRKSKNQRIRRVLWG